VSPFTCEWAILATNCNVSTADGTVIGLWKGDYRANPIVVPPHGKVQTPFLNVDITGKLTLEFFKVIWDALIAKDATMSVQGLLTVRIGGGFEMDLLWEALNIPTSVVSADTPIFPPSDSRA
jgi:hypothetical protein